MKTNKPKKLETVTVTMQEIWQQTTPKVHKSKKHYNRKAKHKKNPDRQNPDSFLYHFQIVTLSLPKGQISSFAFSRALSNPLTSFPPAVAKKACPPPPP